MKTIHLLLLGLLLFSASCDNPISSDVASNSGSITTGASVDLTLQTIPPSGGTITIDRPGDPVDGLVLRVPSGAYPEARTFTISYAPIIAHTFGPLINPVTPLYHVENGGGNADSMMILRVPARVPNGHFPLGFYYDEVAGDLQPMPLFGYDSVSVLIGAPHFSRWFISTVDKKMLDAKNPNSGFAPGQDDWQFPNAGSVIEPEGHCSGQTLTAIWYYVEKVMTVKGKGVKPHLREVGGKIRYDNYRHPLAEIKTHAGSPSNWRKTPQNWEDDVCAIRLASVVQHDEKLRVATTIEKLKSTWDDIMPHDDPEGSWLAGDEKVWYQFKYGMAQTGEPQWVGLFGSDGKHAMIVYKISGNTLCVADPNFPGETNRTIQYSPTAKRFGIYVSGQNRAEKDVGYDRFVCGNPDWMPGKFKSNMEKRWKEFEQGSIGHGTFPVPTVSLNPRMAHARKVNLTDGSRIVLPRNTEFTIWATSPQGDPCYVTLCDGFTGKFERDHNNDGISKYDPQVTDTTMGSPGTMVIGIYIGCEKDLPGNTPWETKRYRTWLDFYWIEITVQ